MGKCGRVIRQYVRLTKPGIIFGNLVSVAGGFFLASKGHVDTMALLATAVGVALVVASGCVFNNLIDRDIDRCMERTRKRPLVTGEIGPRTAALFGSVLGLAGVAVLYLSTNLLAVGLVLGGFVIYVGLYSLYMKRNSVYGTLVGSLAGAAPPIVGYCAVSGRFDTGALILLVIFSLWQMPHSYAIAIFRFKDYAAAAIPVLPVKKGVTRAKFQIVAYILAFAAATVALCLSGYVGRNYLVVAVALSGYWLYMALAGFSTGDDRLWARKIFMFSILIITALSIMMSVDFTGMAVNSQELLTYVPVR